MGYKRFLEKNKENIEVSKKDTMEHPVYGKTKTIYFYLIHPDVRETPSVLYTKENKIMRLNLRLPPLTEKTKLKEVLEHVYDEQDTRLEKRTVEGEQKLDLHIILDKPTESEASQIIRKTVNDYYEYL